jgi:hypothetical protein
MLEKKQKYDPLHILYCGSFGMALCHCLAFDARLVLDAFQQGLDFWCMRRTPSHGVCFLVVLVSSCIFPSWPEK